MSAQSHREMPSSIARRISEATCLLAWVGCSWTRSASTRTARSMTRRSPTSSQLKRGLVDALELTRRDFVGAVEELLELVVESAHVTVSRMHCGFPESSV